MRFSMIGGRLKRKIIQIDTGENCRISIYKKLIDGKATSDKMFIEVAKISIENYINRGNEKQSAIIFSPLLHIRLRHQVHHRLTRTPHTTFYNDFHPELHLETPGLYSMDPAVKQ